MKIIGNKIFETASVCLCISKAKLKIIWSNLNEEEIYLKMHYLEYYIWTLLEYYAYKFWMIKLSDNFPLIKVLLLFLLALNNFYR